MSNAARIAARPASPTIPAATGTVPKCQGLARAQWLADRQAELLPVPYFHLVFTMPAPIAAIALQNKAVVYDILFRAAAETVRTIAADPKHLGVAFGMTAVLHTWGQNLVPSPACALHRAGRRAVARGPLDQLPARLLPAGPGALPPLSPVVPGAPVRSVRCRDAGLLRRVGRARQAGSLRRPSAALAQHRMGRLRQAPVRWPAAGARLSRPLHPSGRHRQQSAHRSGRGTGPLPLEGLPAPAAAQGHDAWPPASSSGVSCCTSCQTASAGSATSASLPTHTAAPSSPRSVARSISLNPREHPNPPIIVSVMPGSLGGHSTSARPAADTSSKSRCSSARRGRRPGPSLATAHERGVGPRLPLPINRAAVRRCDAVVAFGNPCRDRRCHSAPRYPLLGHGGHRAAKRACYRDRANRPLAPSPPASSDPPPGPTPIGPAAQRGFVQSGFNDVPHHANPDDYLAGPR